MYLSIGLVVNIYIAWKDSLLGVLGLQTVRLKQRRDEYATKLEAIEKQMSEQEARAEELEAERLYVQTKDKLIDAGPGHTAGNHIPAQ